MKQRLLFLGALSLLVLVAGPVVVEIIRHDVGYILISIGSSTLEVSFWFGVLVLIVFLVLVFILYKLGLAILRSFGLSLNFLTSGRRRLLARRTNSGLLHFIEGNWRVAKKDLLSVAKHADKPLVHYLAAAHSAHALGEHEETHRLLSLAEQSAQDNELTVLLSQSRIQLAEKKYEQCMASLERARVLAPAHPVMLDLLRRSLDEQGQLGAVVELLPALKLGKYYSEAEMAEIEQSAYCARLQEEFRLGDRDSRVQRLTSFWQKLPRQLRRSHTLVEHYCTMLLQAEEHEMTEKLIRKSLAKSWSGILVSLYGRVLGAQAEQLAVAEQWLRERPGDAELLFTLARIAVRNELWGKARGYFEASLQLQERPEAYAELAALVAKLGDHQKSTALYQKGLLLTIQAQ